jgi:elongation factor Tu
MRTADSAVTVTLPEDKQMVMPGDNLQCEFKLHVPFVMEKGNRFALREGGRTVAAGVITEVIPDTEADIKEEESRK